MKSSFMTIHDSILTSIAFLRTGFKNSCSKASSAVHLFEGLNISIFFNKSIAAGFAAGYRDSKLRTGLFSILPTYSLAWPVLHTNNMNVFC